MIYCFFIITSFFILLGICITKKFINPLSCFNIIWFIVLFLYRFRFSYLQSKLDTNTIILFILNSIFFSFSFIIVYFTKFTRINEKQDNRKINYKFIKTNFYIWCAIEIIEVIYSKGVPLLWKLTGSSKTYFDFGIPTLHGFANAYGLVIIMLLYYYYLYELKNNSIKLKKCIYLIGLMLLFYFCLITRQVIISAILQLFILHLHFANKVNYSKILFFSIMGIIAFGLVGNLRTGYDGFNNVALMKKTVNPFMIGFSWVYMYLTMTVANINNVVLLGIKKLGIYPIAQTYIPTIISNILFSNSIVDIPPYLVSNAFTVSGFFIHFYLAYGVLGVIVICVIYGVMCGIIYKKVIKNTNEKNILYYSVCMQIILLSFFYNHLLYLPSGFQYIIIFLLFKICPCKYCIKD